MTPVLVLHRVDTQRFHSCGEAAQRGPKKIRAGWPGRVGSCNEVRDCDVET
jgi:hypothetical protein